MYIFAICIISFVLTLFVRSIYNEIKKIQTEDDYEAQKNEFKNKIKKRIL